MKPNDKALPQGGVKIQLDEANAQKPKLSGCDVGLGACVEYIKSKIAETETAVKFRDDSYKIWSGGTDASWRAAGCTKSKFERRKTAAGHGRIAIRCRKELQTLQAVLEYLETPTTQREAVDLHRLVRHIAGLREEAQKLEAQCCSQGDYERCESRISDLLEEADELQSMILPNAKIRHDADSDRGRH